MLDVLFCCKTVNVKQHQKTILHGKIVSKHSLTAHMCLNNNYRGKKFKELSYFDLLHSLQILEKSIFPSKFIGSDEKNRNTINLSWFFFSKIKKSNQYCFCTLVTFSLNIPVLIFPSTYQSDDLF